MHRSVWLITLSFNLCLAHYQAHYQAHYLVVEVGVPPIVVVGVVCSRSKANDARPEAREERSEGASEEPNLLQNRYLQLAK
jgi:hypothetical protein